MLSMRRYRSQRKALAFRPVQSFKQIVVDGPASRAAATNIVTTLSNGVDNYSGPSANNYEVPTGATIKSFNVQICLMNLVSQVINVVVTLQLKRDGQSITTPNAQGGAAGRNRVFYTKQLFIGKDQQNNLEYNFKIPKKYQRVRETDQWSIVIRGDATFSSLVQGIYKFYR